MPLSKVWNLAIKCHDWCFNAAKRLNASDTWVASVANQIPYPMVDVDTHAMAPWPDLPAKHHYSPFFDFLADALYQHRHAKEAARTYDANRFARASVISAALSVECLSNCLLADLELPAEQFKVADRMSPLDKISEFFALRGISGFSKGVRTTQRCFELLKIRDSYVHPKNAQESSTLGSPKDGGKYWRIPVAVDLALWPNLRIPKGTFAWDAETSEIALEAAFRFHQYVLEKIRSDKQQNLSTLIATRMIVGDSFGLVMPLYDEMKIELKAAREYGLKFDELGLSSFLE